MCMYAHSAFNSFWFVCKEIMNLKFLFRKHITDPVSKSERTYRINVYVIVVLLMIHGFEETLDLSVCATVYRQNERYSDVVCDVRL